ncbi:uncharacterized protein LOC114787569 isoform X3 [Denticeps clupeoides]|uniref:uncharacterized protein LOC114787569 isoform X3 n=1 Tax=Denticeps clupeoides TaxID=299321 RepID=UPI0010A2AFAE|nr:uncharacterized protein LOC114787569 isoform X3 [Denticeps clupeoides]
MSSSSDVQSQLTSIMEVFAKSALAEMCKVVENDSAVLRLAISRQEREIGLLWRRLQLAENEAKAARRAEALRAATSSRSVGVQVDNAAAAGRGDQATSAGLLAFSSWTDTDWKDSSIHSFTLQAVNVDKEQSESPQVKEEKTEEEPWTNSHCTNVKGEADGWEEDTSSTPAEAGEGTQQNASIDGKQCSVWEHCTAEDPVRSQRGLHQENRYPQQHPADGGSHVVQEQEHIASDAAETSDNCEKRSRCGQCGKTFTTRFYLKIHQRIHTGTVADVDDALAAFTQSILPNLTSQQSLINALKGLGVETLDDLKYVQDTDLSDVLRPIEARKLISRLKVQDNEASNSEITVRRTDDRTSNPSLVRFIPSLRAVCSGSESSSCADTPSDSSFLSTQTRKQYTDHDWHHDFVVPWSKIPHSVRTKFEKQERPSGRERREIVRLIVDEVLTVCQNPRKKHLAEIARKMALKYPKSFKDISGHQTTGSGYDSLTKQLQCRVDNLKRENVRFQLKRRHTKTLKTETQDVRSKKTRLDSYGCINWQPSCLPLQETTKTQKEKQEELLNLHRDGVKDHNKIVKLMISTFRAQRKDIVTGTGTHELSKMWPYLFEMCGSKAHFHKLTGVSLNANFYAAMSSKCGRILNYFQSLPQGQNEKISKILINFDERSTEATILTCVQILLVYFSEDEEKLMVKVEDTCLPCEVTSEQLPTTPCIVLCGSNALTADLYMVSVDKIIVNKALSSFGDALVLMFTCYYMLNINYPVEVCATLDFLQRYIFKINPDKGAKVDQKQSKKQYAMNPKVLSLMTSIADFE